jgi:hypothetical protein
MVSQNEAMGCAGAEVGGTRVGTGVGATEVGGMRVGTGVAATVGAGGGVGLAQAASISIKINDISINFLNISQSLLVRTSDIVRR